MAQLCTIIELSTGNLQKEVSDQLNECGNDERIYKDWRDHLTCSAYPYGYFIRIPSRDKWEDFPSSLQDCFAHAAKYGATYICFDRDNDGQELRNYDGRVPFDGVGSPAQP